MSITRTKRGIVILAGTTKMLAGRNGEPSGWAHFEVDTRVRVATLKRTFTTVYIPTEGPHKGKRLIAFL